MMKLGNLAGAIAAASLLGAAGAALAVPVASAATVYTVDVWTGAPNGVTSSTTADAAGKPTGPAAAQFTFTGPINWYVGGPQNSGPSGNLFSTFFNTYTSTSDISNFSSPSGAFSSETAFLGASMSDAGDSYASYFQIVGSYSDSTVTGTISHDDGASVYDYLGNAVYSSPAETSDITGAFTLPGGTHSFTVDYVEGNGAPSVLDLSISAVPEPATWAVMLVGFFGMGTMMRRARAKRGFIAA
jgi:hypothetical protein